MSVMIGYFTETVTESLSHFTNFFFLLDIVHCSNCQHDNMLFVCLCTFPISFSMILDYGDTKTGLRSSWHAICVTIYVHIRILDHVIDLECTHMLQLSGCVHAQVIFNCARATYCQVRTDGTVMQHFPVTCGG